MIGCTILDKIVKVSFTDKKKSLKKDGLWLRELAMHISMLLGVGGEETGGRLNLPKH